MDNSSEYIQMGAKAFEILKQWDGENWISEL